MKSLPRRLGLGAGLLLFAYLVGSLDWRGEVPDTPPVLERVESRSRLRAGVASVDFTPDHPVPLGGFARRDGAFTEVLDPVKARALVFSAGSLDLALVSLDLLLIPDTLAARIASDAQGAGIDRVIVTATHTHGAPGGYWDNLVARFGGLGSHDPELEQAIADAAGTALRAARGKLEEVELTLREGEGPELCRSRVEGRAPDRRLTLLTLRRISASHLAEDAPEGGSERRRRPAGEAEAVPGETSLEPGARGSGRSPAREVLARVVVFACHPTVLGHTDRRLSAEWPGALAAALEGTTLLLQGSQGEVTHGEVPGVEADAPREEKMRALGAAVAEAVRALEASEGQPVERLAHTRATLALPGPSARGFAPTGLEGITSNLLMTQVPDRATVSVLELGPLDLLLVPGEVVSPLGARWAREAADRRGGQARVVSLADGYLGYLETPEALEAGLGESKRAFFGADAVRRLEEALVAASPPR
ncbi:MAG: hypothetical protein P1V51_05160 [Deltaproteobacteria bacterium]|nr:hypothetical protein [Deltaproteobacteria bacterium]